METAVLFIIFNRPDTTQLVFEEIRKAKPAKLFIAADGPRLNREGDVQKCSKTRKIVEQVDWPCEVKTLFQPENLGCKRAVSSAIDWFFEHVEEGIILEDDCLPHPSFFSFCETLLEKYRTDERVMMISGDNFQNGVERGDGSYYFSRLSHIWGWATWKRAWQFYDVTMLSFPAFKQQNRIADIFENKDIQNYWINIFDKVYEDQIDTWDYQWTYAVMCQNGLSIMPNKNLISNIGCGNADATHTIEINHHLANLKTEALNTLIHPTFVLADKAADLYTLFSVIGVSKPRKTLRYRLKRLFGKKVKSHAL